MTVHAGDYDLFENMHWLCFHLDRPGWLACLSSSQQGSIAGVIELLASEETAALENNMAKDDLLIVLGKLEQAAAGRDTDAPRPRST